MITLIFPFCVSCTLQIGTSRSLPFLCRTVGAYETAENHHCVIVLIVVVVFVVQTHGCCSAMQFAMVYK